MKKKPFESYSPSEIGVMLIEEFRTASEIEKLVMFGRACDLANSLGAEIKSQKEALVVAMDITERAEAHLNKRLDSLNIVADNLKPESMKIEKEDLQSLLSDIKNLKGK